MTEKRFYVDKSGDFNDTETGNIIVDFAYFFNGMECKMILDLLNSLNDENEQLKIRNKGKQAFINKQDKIIKLLYNQCKDFKEILDDSNITYPIDERLNKFFEEGVKL